MACTYSFDDWKCPRQAYGAGSTCILHLGPNNDADKRWVELTAYVKSCIDARREVVLHGMNIVDAYPLRAALEVVPVRGKAVAFYRSVDFEGLTVAHPLQLQRCRFHQGASFRKCTFNSYVEWDHNEFQDVLRMQHCKFAHIVGLEDSKILGGFYVERVEFAGLHLRRAILGGLVMRNVIHNKAFLLQRVEITGPVSFEHCTLDAKVMWGSAHLQKSIRVTDCILDGHWLGDGGLVEGAFEVARLQLNGRMDFQGATFGDGAAFRDIHMGPGARANFTAARFHGEAVFENWTDPETDTSERALVIFSRVPVLPDSRFKFRGVSKDDAKALFRIRMFSFLHTDVSGFRFGNVDWMQKPAWPTWRQRQINKARKLLGMQPDPFLVPRVVDEDFLTRRPGQPAAAGAQPWRADPSLVADLYRDLRQAYESRGSYHEAGQFHVREMEMRRVSRMDAKTHRARAAVERGALNLYRAFSLYGESYTRPLAWLGGLLMAAWLWHSVTQGRLEAFRILPDHLAFVEGMHILFPFLTGGIIDGALRILALTIAALLVMALRRAFMRHG